MNFIIKVLLLQPEINKEFIFQYQDNNTYDNDNKTYGEQFESNWWNITEKTFLLITDYYQ